MSKPGSDDDESVELRSPRDSSSSVDSEYGQTATKLLQTLNETRAFLTDESGQTDLTSCQDESLKEELKRTKERLMKCMTQLDRLTEVSEKACVEFQSLRQTVRKHIAIKKEADRSLARMRNERDAAKRQSAVLLQNLPPDQKIMKAMMNIEEMAEQSENEKEALQKQIDELHQDVRTLKDYIELRDREIKELRKQIKQKEQELQDLRMLDQILPEGDTKAQVPLSVGISPPGSPVQLRRHRNGTRGDDDRRKAQSGSDTTKSVDGIMQRISEEKDDCEKGVPPAIEELQDLLVTMKMPSLDVRDKTVGLGSKGTSQSGDGQPHQGRSSVSPRPSRASKSSDEDGFDPGNTGSSSRSSSNRASSSSSLPGAADQLAEDCRPPSPAPFLPDRHSADHPDRAVPEETDQPPKGTVATLKNQFSIRARQSGSRQVTGNPGKAAPSLQTNSRARDKDMTVNKPEIGFDVAGKQLSSYFSAVDVDSDICPNGSSSSSTQKEFNSGEHVNPSHPQDSFQDHLDKNLKLSADGNPATGSVDNAKRSILNKANRKAPTDFSSMNEASTDGSNC